MVTPRERILAALNHIEPDRPAIDFAGTDASGVHAIAYDKLRKYIDIEPRPLRGEEEPVLNARDGADSLAVAIAVQESASKGLPVDPLELF